MAGCVINLLSTYRPPLIAHPSTTAVSRLTYFFPSAAISLLLASFNIYQSLVTEKGKTENNQTDGSGLVWSSICYHTLTGGNSPMISPVLSLLISREVRNVSVFILVGALIFVGTRHKHILHHIIQKIYHKLSILCICNSMAYVVR